jgi:plastocyanin
MTGEPARGGNSPAIKIAAAVILVLIVAFIGLVIWGVAQGGSDDDDDVAASPTVVDDTEFTIRIADFEFEPDNVSVPAGAVVTWLNEDGDPHDATHDEGDWETARLRRDDTEAITFDDPGVYPYHCSIHPYMKGSLTVREQPTE